MLRLFMLISLSIVLCILVKEGLEEQTPRYAKRDWRQVPTQHVRPDREEPPGAAYQDRIPCKHDIRCLKGECWEGFCNEEGHCRSMWTCA